MAKFIDLQLNEVTNIYINVDNIVCLNPRDKEDKARVFTSDGEYWDVKDTINEVLYKINLKEENK